MLNELMDDRRINQSQLGRETGIPQATISRYPKRNNQVTKI